MATLTVSTSPSASSAPSNPSSSASLGVSSGNPSNASGASGSNASGSAFQTILDQQKPTGAQSREPSGPESSNKPGTANTQAGSEGARSDAASGTKSKDAKTTEAVDAAQAASAAQAIQAHAAAVAQPPAGVAVALAAPATPADPSSRSPSDTSAGTTPSPRAALAVNGSTSVAGSTGIALNALNGLEPGTQTDDGVDTADAHATLGTEASGGSALGSKVFAPSATAHATDGGPASPISTVLHTAVVTDPASLAAAAGASSAAPVSMTAPTAPSSSISAPIGSDDFSSETASKILYFVQNGVQSAQLHLNPAHLGPLDVQIRMDGNQVNVALTSVHVETRHALEASLPQLRQMFGEQGIALGDVSVGARAFSNGSGAEQQQFSGHSGGFAQRTSAVSIARDVGSIAPLVRRSIQLVDTFA